MISTQTTAHVASNPSARPGPHSADTTFSSSVEQRIHALATDTSAPRQSHYNVMWRGEDGKMYCHKIELFQLLSDPSGEDKPVAVSLTLDGWKEIAAPLIRETLEKIQKIAKSTFNPKHDLSFDVNAKNVTRFVTTEPAAPGSPAKIPVNVLTELAKAIPQDQQQLVKLSNSLFLGITKLQPQIVPEGGSAPSTSSTSPTPGLSSSELDVDEIYRYDIYQSLTNKLISGKSLSAHSFADASIVLFGESLPNLPVFLDLDPAKPPARTLDKFCETQIYKDQLNKKTEPYFIPVRSKDDKPALLYFLPQHNENPEEWHYYDPTGKELPNEFRATIEKATGKKLENIIDDSKNSPEQETTDQINGELYVLRKILYTLHNPDEKNRKNITEFREFILSEYEKAIATQIKASKEFFTNTDNIHIPEDKMTLVKNIISGSAKTKLTKSASGPLASPKPSETLISVYDGSQKDALELLQKSPSDSTMIWSFANPASHSDQELQMISPFSVFENEAFQNCSGSYYKEVPILGNSIIYPISIGFSNIKTLDKNNVTNTRNGYELTNETRAELQEKILSILATAEANQHKTLIIPAFPIDPATPLDIKRAIDEEIAKLFLHTLQHNFSNYKVQIIFAAASEPDRNPGAAIYSQFAQSKANFPSGVTRLNNSGHLIEDPMRTVTIPSPLPVSSSSSAATRLSLPPALPLEPFRSKATANKPLVGIRHEGDTCFFASVVPTMILTDPILEQVLVEQGNGKSAEIGRYLHKYRKDQDAGRISTGIAEMRRGLHRLSPTKQFLGGQQDPDEVMGVIHGDPEISQKLINAGYYTPQTISTVYHLPQGYKISDSREIVPLAPGDPVDQTYFFEEQEIIDSRGSFHIRLDGSKTIEQRVADELILVNKNPAQREASDGKQILCPKAQQTRKWAGIPQQLSITVAGRVQWNGVTGQLVKDTKELVVGEKLALPQDSFEDGVLEDGTPPTYELLSFTQHAGTADGGHFVGYIKRGDDYYKMDDTATPDARKCIKLSGKQEFLDAAKTAYQIRYQLLATEVLV